MHGKHEVIGSIPIAGSTLSDRTTNGAVIFCVCQACFASRWTERSHVIQPAGRKAVGEGTPGSKEVLRANTERSESESKAASKSGNIA